MNSKTNVRERINHISHIALTILLSLAAILVVYQFVLLPLAEAAPTTDAGRGSDVLSQLGPRTAVTLILAMIVLVGLVFALFISFGRRLQMRSFLGPLVADAVARSEIARQEARLREDLKSGKIAPKLEPGSEEFNRRYGIPLNEPIPPLRPGVEMDETGRNPRIVGYADGWGNQLPGLPGGTMNPFSGFDNDRPSGSSKPDDGEQLYAFAAKLRTQIPNWTPERLVAEREASRPEDDQPGRKKAEMALTAIAIKNEIDRRFLFGYQQEQINAFNKNRSDITARERKRTEDLLPTIDVSSFGGGWTFVLEFTTIIFIVFSVLALGLLGVLNSEPIATILAAIAGYVLGKSTSHREAGGEEVRRGGEEPKALLEALTKQEEIKSLRNEEKSKLEREVEALQQKLAQSNVTVPDVRGLIADEAVNRVRQKHLVPTKKEVENSKAETGKVFDHYRTLMRNRRRAVMSCSLLPRKPRLTDPLCAAVLRLS